MKKLMCLFAVLMFGGIVSGQGATHGAVLTWIASPDGAANPTLAYNIYRGTTAGGEGSTPINSTPVAAGCSNTSTCTYTDTPVTLGVTYYYTLKATMGGAVSASSNEISFTVPIAPPSGLSCKSN